jgi:PEP-CTERM motif
MKFAFRQTSLVVFILALPAFAEPASAGLITQTENYPSALASFSVPLSFTKFNTQLGTLTGVSVALSMHGTVTSQVLSTSSQSQTFTSASTTSTVSIAAPASVVISASLLTTPVAGTISANATMTIGTDSGTVGSSSSLGSFEFAPYESSGAGSYVINAVAANTNSGSTNSARVAIAGFSTVGGSLVITYTYLAAVPEPASLGMVVLGLGFVAAIRRIRRELP